MYYIIYLVCMFLLLYGAACIRYTAHSLIFVPSQLLNFIDLRSFVFLLIPCLLVLFCTKSFRSFGRSFLFMSGKKCAVAKDSLYALVTVMVTAVIAGIIHSITLILNFAYNMNLESGLLTPLNDMLLALLSPLYSLVLCLMLLPVLISVWKHLHTTTVICLQKAAHKKLDHK